ncbi:MAG: AAA family ATPase [Cenarchaeum sp. SB0665_bin_23]|nr:AAA family ATPase [Cenarchaeum sp. SB0665_bin_23]MXZ93152.1 AAA family ATPase [Cenarchaeum sp. SB0666_bin_15]MYB47419.1 AAA family ATPase [Cenarchaeum sp. SB0662_bin_33]MYD59123.1 AAA family ATPase [Cenarchaeum sp. SB0678_bin_8]MYG32889.1 AAA family ATPase [Cenarchaeum sp. SB0677_bin_16]MYJ27242.1 AAA family ATPase [Cenarchaeum sp. SB0672_bin_9]
MDAIDRLLDEAESGLSLIRDRSALRFTFIPDKIQHRDNELTQVTQSLLPILKQSRPSNLLVYGKPGTGKTLVVRKVISKIQKRVEVSNFPIKLVYTNSKVETTLYGLLLNFGRQLNLSEKELPWTGISISEVFRRILDVIDGKRLNVVLVIDEIDFLVKLVTKGNKDILYHITRANERLTNGSLTLVGISNNLTFKDHLDPRVISTLGEEEVVFTSYTIPQLLSIIQERVNMAFDRNVVDDATLNLCAAYAGREHGDARRAIDLIRVAGEIAERDQSTSVQPNHIEEALRKIEEDKETAAIKSYPLHEKLLILSVMRTDGSTTGGIYTTYKEMCKKIQQKELSYRRITQMLSEIEMSGIISGRLIHQGIHGNTKKFKLTISQNIVKDTLYIDDTLKELF